MTTTLRRVVWVLQAGLIVGLVAGAGLAFLTGSFIRQQIGTELTSQQIFFPAAGSKSLPASEYPELQQYGSKQVVDGEMAKAYANGFIGRHLKNVADGLTYSQMSAKAMANPTDTKMAAQVATLFKGETLRGLLLNAYGWWTIGTYALYAAIAMVSAAGAVFLALASQVYLAIRGRRKVTAPVVAPKPQRAIA